MRNTYAGHYLVFTGLSYLLFTWHLLTLLWANGVIAYFWRVWQSNGMEKSLLGSSLHRYDHMTVKVTLCTNYQKKTVLVEIRVGITHLPHLPCRFQFITC